MTDPLIPLNGAATGISRSYFRTRRAEPARAECSISPISIDCLSLAAEAVQRQKPTIGLALPYQSPRPWTQGRNLGPHYIPPPDHAAE